MGLRQFVFMTGALTVICATPATASVLGDLADECMAAIEAGDDAAFSAAADAIRSRDDVFDTSARKRAEACLSQGFGEPWEYWYPSEDWEPSSAIQARMTSTAEAKAKTAAEAAEAEAARISNAAQVAELVYRSCGTLLARDEVAAMTNALCVESFLTNGLPGSAAP